MCAVQPKEGVYCENIKKILDGSFLLVGWDSSNKGWVYKLSANENYQWDIVFDKVQSLIVNANQMENGDIILLLSRRDTKINIIVLDSDGNVISMTEKSTNIFTAYDGIVSKIGTVVITDFIDIFVFTKCDPGTYYSSEVGYCIPCAIMTYQDLVNQNSCKDCLEGEYQDKEGQSSCKRCISSCESCTTETNCLKCLAGFYLEAEDLGKVSCVEKCKPGYYGNSITRECEGKYIFNILSLH